MLLHPRVTNFVIFIVPIIKAVFARWIFQNAVLRNGILNIIPVRARGLAASLDPQKVRFFTEAK